MSEPLAEFLATFHGVLTDPPEHADLLRWCASADGQAHDAPAVTIDATSAAYFIFTTDAARVRFAAMYADFADWIVNTIQRPPGWKAIPIPDADTNNDVNLLRKAWARPDPSLANELRDWARAWTAAHPS